jgi:hypothetical protein
MVVTVVATPSVVDVVADESGAVVEVASDVVVDCANEESIGSRAKLHTKRPINARRTQSTIATLTPAR